MKDSHVKIKMVNIRFTTSVRRLLLPSLFFGPLLSASSFAQIPNDTPSVSVVIRDLGPKFVSFYNEAIRLNLSENDRWILWKRKYDFAAVPRTAQGDSIARKLLDNAWPRYPRVVRQIEDGNAIGKPDPMAVLSSVARLLKPEKPVKVTLLSYVGGFDDNAFTNASGYAITVAIPRESTEQIRELLMAHEFTHAMQIAMGYLSGGYVRMIGAIVVSEGLATRITQFLHPGLPDDKFIEIRPGWLKDCQAHETTILRDIRTSLFSTAQKDIMQFTMGKRETGFEREAYFTGWVVIQYWLSKGMTFGDIARIPESEMPAKAAAAIDEILTTIKKSN